MDVQCSPQQCVRTKEYIWYVKLKEIVNTFLIIARAYWDKNETFHNCFWKSVKDEILVIDNLSLFQIDGAL